MALKCASAAAASNATPKKKAVGPNALIDIIIDLNALVIVNPEKKCSDLQVT